MAEDPVVNTISTENKNSKDEINSIPAKESSRGITEPVALEKQLKVEDGQHNPSSKTEEIITKTEETTQENDGILLETDENEAANSSIRVDHFTESSLQVMGTLEGALETSNAGEKREDPTPIIAKELENDSQLQKQHISESEEGKHRIKKTDSSEAEVSEEIEGESSKIVSEDRNVGSIEERDKPGKEKPISAIGLDEPSVSQAAVATDPVEHEKGSKNNEDLPGSAAEEQNLEVGAGSEIKEREIETEETTEKNDGKSVACLIEETDHEKLSLRQFSSSDADGQIPVSADHSKLMESEVQHEEKVSNQSFNTISVAQVSDEESQQKGGPASEKIDRTAESVSDEQIVKTNTAGRDADEASVEKHSDVSSSGEVPEGKTDLGKVGATESVEAEDCEEEGSIDKDLDADAVHIRQESEESRLQEDRIEGKEIETVTTDPNTQNNETKNENNEESSALVHDKKIRQPNDAIQNIEEEIRQKEDAAYVTTVTEETSLQKAELEEQKPKQAADIASEEKSRETNEADSQLEEVEGVKIEETSIPASEIPPVGESDGADKEKPDELPVIQALVKEIPQRDESQDNEPKCVSKPVPEEKNAEEIIETGIETAEIQKEEESPHEVPSTEAEANARKKIQTEADFLEKNADISSIAPASKEMPLLKEEGEKTLQKAELEDEKHEQGADIVSEEKSHETNETGSHFEEVEVVKTEETSIPASKIPLVGESDGADKESPVEVKPLELPVIQALVKEILQRDESQDNKPKGVSKPVPEEKNAEDIIETENATAEIQKEEESPHEVPSTEVEADAREKIETEIRSEADFLEKNPDISSVAPASEEMPSLKEEGEHANIIPQTVPSERDFDSLPTTQEATGGTDIVYENPAKASDIASEEEVERTADANTSSSEILVDDSSDKKLQEFSELKSEERVVESVHVREKTDEPQVTQALIEESLQKHKIKGQGPEKATELVLEEKNAEEIIVTENAAAEIPKEEENPHETPATETPAEEDTQDHGLKTADTRANIKTEIPMEEEIQENNVDASSVPPVEETSTQQEQGQQANIVPETVSKDCDCDASSTMQEVINSGEIEYERLAKASDKVPEDQEAETSSSQILVDDSPIEKLHESSELKPEDQIPIGNGTQDKHVEERCLQGEVEGDKLEEVTAAVSEDKETTSETETIREIRKDKESSQKEENEKPYKAPDLEAKDNVSEAKEADKDLEREIAEEKKESYESTISSSTLADDKAGENLAEPVEEVSDEQDLGTTDSGSKIENEVPNKEKAHHINVNASYVSQSSEEICSQKEAAETEETQNKGDDIAAATQAQGEKAFDSASEDTTVETVVEAEPAKIKISEGNESCDTMIDSPSTVKASVEETTQGAPADELEENTEKKIEKSEATAGTSSQIEEMEGKMLGKDYEHPEQKLSEITNAGEISNDADTSEPISNKDTLEGKKIEKTFDAAPEELETTFGREVTTKEVLEKEEVPVKNLEESFQEDGKGVESREHGAAELHRASYNTTNEEILRAIDPPVEIEADETKDKEIPDNNIDNLPVRNAVAEETIQEKRGEEQDETSEFVPEETAPEKVGSASESVSKDQGNEKITETETTETLPSVTEEQTCKAVEVSESKESAALEEEKTSDGATSGSQLQMENEEDGKELDSGDKSENFVALESREEEMPKKEETSGTDLENDGTEYDQLEKPADIVSEVLETAHQSEEIEKQIVEEEGTGKGIDTIPAGDEQVEESLEESEEHKMPEGATPELDAEDLSCNTNDISEITIPHEEVSEALAVDDLDTLSATDKPAKESSWEDEKTHEKLEEATRHLEAEGQSCEAIDTNDDAKDGQNEEVQASDLVSEERDLKTIASTEKIETVTVKAAEDPNETIDASTVKITESDEPLAMVSEGPETTSGGEDSEKHIIEGTVKGVDDVSVQEEPVGESQCKKLDEVTPEMEVEDQTCKTNDIIEIPNEEVFEGHKAADAGENVEKQTTEEEGVVKDLNTSSTRAAAIEENFQEDEHKKLEEATPQLEAEDQHYESNDTTYPTKSSQNDQVEASDLVSKEQEYETTGPTEAIESVTTKSDENPNEMSDASPVKTASIENPSNTVPEGIETAGVCKDAQKQIIEEEGTVKGIDDVPVQDESVEEIQCKKFEEATPEFEAEDQSCRTNDIINIPNEKVSEGLMAAAASENVQKQKTEEEGVVKDLNTSSTTAVMVEENLQEVEHKELEEATPQSAAEDGHDESNDGIDPTKSGQNEEVTHNNVEASDLVSTTSSTEAIETATSKGEEDTHKIADALPVETASTENPLGMVSEGLETAGRDKDAQKHIIEEEGTVKGIDTVSIIDEPVQESEECKKPKEATFELEAEDQSYHTNDVTNITKVSEGHEATVTGKDIEKPLMEEVGAVKDLDSLSAKDESAEESIQEDLKEHKKLEEATTLLEIEDVGSKANDTIDTTQNGQDEEVKVSDLVSKERDFETTASAEKIETVTLRGLEDPNVIIDASPVTTTSAEIPLNTVSEELGTIDRGEEIEKQITEEEGTAKSLDSASVGEEPFEESESQKLEEKTPEMEANDQSHKTDDNREINNSNMEVPEVLEAAGGCENSEKQTIEEERAVKDLDTLSAKEEEICSQKEAAETEETQNKRHDIAAATQAQGEKAFDSVSEDETIETVAEAEPAKIEISESNVSCDAKIDSPSTVEASVEETTRKGAPADVLEENTEKKIEKSEAIAGTSLQIEETEVKTLDKDYEHPEQKLSEIINAGKISNDGEASEPSSNKDTLEGEKIGKTSDTAPEEFETAGGRADTEKDALEKEEVPVKNLEESFKEDGKGGELLEHGAAELHCVSYNTTNETTNEEVSEALAVADESENVEKQTKEEGGIGDLYTISATDKPVKESTQEDEKKHEKLEEPTHHLEAEEQSCKANDTSEAAKDGQNEEVQASDLVSEERDLETIASTEKIETVILKAAEDPNETIDASSVKIAMSDEPLESVSEGPETTGGGEDSEKHIIEGTVKGVDDVSVQGEPVEESQCKKLDEVTSKMEVEDQTCKTNDIIDIPNEEVFEVYKAADAGENVEKQTIEEEGVVKDLNTSSTRAAAVEENFQEDEHKKHEEATPQLEAEDQHYESDDAIDPTKSSQNEEVKASYLVPKEQEFETTSSTEAIESVGSKGDGDQNEMTDASPVKTASTEHTLDRLPVELEIAGEGEDTQKQTIEEEVTVKGVDTASIIDEQAQESEECEKPKEATFELEAEDQSCHTNDVNNITEVSEGHEAAVVGKDIEKPLMEEEDAVMDLDSLSAKGELAKESILEDLKGNKKLEEATPHLEIEDKDSEEKDTIDTTQTGQHKEVSEALVVADASENVEKQTKEEGGIGDLYAISATDKPVKESTQEDEKKHEKLEEPTHHLEAEEQSCKANDTSEAAKDGQNEEVQASDLVSEERDLETIASTEKIETVILKATEDPNETIDASSVKIAMSDEPLESVSEGPETTGGGEDSEKHIIKGTVKGVDGVSVQGEPVEESQCKKLDEVTSRMEVEDQTCKTNDVIDIPNEEVFEVYKAADAGENVEKQTTEEEGVVKDLNTSSTRAAAVEENFQEDEHKKHEEATPQLEAEDQHYESDDAIDPTKSSQNEEVKASYLVPKEQDFETTSSTEAIESVGSKGDGDQNEMTNASPVKTASTEYTLDRLPVELERAGVGEDTQKQTIEEEVTIKGVDTASTIDEPAQESEECEKPKEATFELEAEDQSCHTNDVNNITEVSKGHEAAVVVKDIEKPLMEEEDAVTDLDSLSAKDESAEESILEDLKEKKKLEEATPHLEIEDKDSEEKDTIDTTQTGQDKEVKALNLVTKEQDFETTASTEKIETVTLKGDEDPNVIIDASPVKTTSAETPLDTVSEKLEIEKQIIEEEDAVKSLDRASVGEEPIQESESQKLEEKTAEMEANDQSHKTEDITEIENSNVEVPEGLEAASGCENSEKQMIEEERAVKDLDTLSSKDEAVEESFQEALKEHKKLDEATCHSEAEEQSCEVNDTTHTITDSQSEEVEASDLVSTERNFETTLSTEKIEAVTLKSDENPNEVIDSSPIETPSGEETKQEGGGAEHQEAIGFVSEEKSIVLDITTEDTEDKKPERALESVSEEGGPSKIEILNDDESPDKTVDALPNSRASVQESTQKETPQVEDEQCCKEPNELSESTESTVLDEVKAANGTESEQLETSCEFGSEDKSKQTDTGDNKADDIAKEEETLYADMEEDRTESEQLQEPSQTSVGLKTAVADENTENQIIEQKSSVADIDTAFVGVEAVEETIQEDENESMKVGEAAAELEPEGQTSETKETNETATNRVHIEEASMGLGAADSSENIEKHMTGEDKAAKELDTIPVRGEVPSLETNDADDTTKTGIPSEKIETVIVEDDKASHKNTDVFPITTTLTEEITREEACDAKEEIHETISANERNVEVAMDEVRISEGPIEVEKVSTFDDSDSICETSNLSDAAEAPNLKDDKVLNRSPDVSAIAKASGVEILRKENATEASIWVPEEITEAAFEKAAAEESFSKGEIEREKLKEEVIHQTRETETSKHEENQQMGLDSPPIPKASVVEILQKEGQKPGKASDLESDEQIQEIIGPKDVEEIHIPRPEESTYELQDPEKLQDTTDVVLEELGHEKVGARETAEIAIEEEENPQKNIDGLSVTHRSDEGGKIEETADSLPEAPSDETVTAIDSTDPAPTETTTLESKEENVKFVTIPESEKTESVTLTAEESLNRSFDVFSFPQASGEETSQIEGSEKHAGSKEILQDNDNKATLQNSCDLIEKTSQKAIVEDQKLGEASEVEADLKGAKLEEKAPGRAAKERTEAPTEDSIEELKESDSGKVSLSDLLERSKRDNMKMPADLMQERHPAVDEDELRNKQAAAHQAEEEKSDEEEEEDDEHKKDESGSDAPVIVEAARDIDLKPPHKKSHNILSGVGSKVKHSIAKVKKAITGKSTHPKSLPAK
ncbi:uncharacterized protein LOC131237902 isoform X5 [Magnolia sinica]|uniref:uncharacterized protein LOC131237902 isoform X5 n=1 Tax=Magnolia sinica TaxID=86752 RepID=UPI002659B6B8|nr:uncharacterized protein LOC131237902 isoform X5 [Magnolia sinica]